MINMQCSRCSYIQFKSSSKCANCGYGFKKLKSNASAKAENTFTIFATVGAGGVASNNASGIEEDYQQESSMADNDSTELYDSLPEEPTDQNDSNIENFGDFELDLSGSNDPNSESWDIGATLTQDHSETTGVANEDLLKDANLETGEFEVQGLGFDFNSEGSNKEDSAKEENPELDDFFLPDPEESSSIDMSDIPLETELDIEDKGSEQTPDEAPVDLNSPEIELPPTPELEELQLDLGTDDPKVEPKQTDLSSGDDETPLEDLELKMDSDEDEDLPSDTIPLFPEEKPKSED